MRVPSRSLAKVWTDSHGVAEPLPLTVNAWTRTEYSVRRCRSVSHNNTATKLSSPLIRFIVKK